MDHLVFVHGTLRMPSTRQMLEGRRYGVDISVHSQHAFLPNWKRDPLWRLNVIPAVGHVVEDGMILRVNDAGLAVMDDFESVASGLYERFRVRPVAEDGREHEAWVYVLTDEARRS